MTAVADQFADVSKRLETQLIRIGQLQQQLDQQHKELVEALQRLEEIYRELRPVVTAQ